MQNGSSMILRFVALCALCSVVACFLSPLGRQLPELWFAKNLRDLLEPITAAKWTYAMMGLSCVVGVSLLGFRASLQRGAMGLSKQKGSSALMYIVSGICAAFAVAAAMLAGALLSFLSADHGEVQYFLRSTLAFYLFFDTLAVLYPLYVVSGGIELLDEDMGRSCEVCDKDLTTNYATVVVPSNADCSGHPIHLHCYLKADDTECPVCGADLRVQLSVIKEYVFTWMYFGFVVLTAIGARQYKAATSFVRRRLRTSSTEKRVTLLEAGEASAC